MDQQTTKATVVRVFKHGDIELRLTEKNAVTVYQNTDRGVQFRFSVMPRDVETHALLGSTAFQEVFESPEWASNLENKEINKARDYAIKQLQKATIREQLKIQAAKETLRSMGMNPDEILKPKVAPKAS